LVSSYLVDVHPRARMLIFLGKDEGRLKALSKQSGMTYQR
jgi:hypothetical protein